MEGVETVKRKTPGSLAAFLFGGCLAGCIVPFAVLILIVASVSSFVKNSLCADDMGSGSDYAVNFYRHKGETIEDSARVAFLTLKGAIESDEAGEGFLFAQKSRLSHPLVEKIEQVTHDESFVGIYLEIDSPGGEVTLSDQIRDKLERFKASAENRFVFVHFGAMACSGAYYIATAADGIMAAPTSLTGSIGVIIPAVNASKLADTIGIKRVKIASSDNKALIDPIEPVNEEHKKILQRTVDQAYDRFLGLVSASRKIPRDKLLPVADGRVLTASDALEAGLIDSIGYRDDAFDAIFEKLTSSPYNFKGVEFCTLDSNDMFPVDFKAFNFSSRSVRAFISRAFFDGGILSLAEEGVLR
jgi:signal peptide peptidase SppA